MRPQIRLSAAAKRDIAKAKEWYALRAHGLDLRFQQEIEHIFEQAERFPEMFPVVYRDVRQANLHRFPYGVYYHRRGDVLYILAVTHHSQHVRTWQRRR